MVLRFERPCEICGTNKDIREAQEFLRIPIYSVKGPINWGKHEMCEPCFKALLHLGMVERREE